MLWAGFIGKRHLEIFAAKIILLVLMAALDDGYTSFSSSVLFIHNTVGYTNDTTMKM